MRRRTLRFLERQGMQGVSRQCSGSPLAMGRTGASAAAGHLAVKITQHVKEQRIGSTITELKSGRPRHRGHLNDGKLQKRFKRVLPCFRLMCNLLRRAKLPRTANITMIMPAKIILFCVESKSFSQIMILISFLFVGVKGFCRYRLVGRMPYFQRDTTDGFS